MNLDCSAGPSSAGDSSTLAPVTEWPQSSAFYSRVTVTPQPELNRPGADFGGHYTTTSLQSWGVPGHPESQYIRRDLMDLGSVQDRFEFGRILKILFSFFKKNFLF